MRRQHQDIHDILFYLCEEINKMGYFTSYADNGKLLYVRPNKDGRIDYRVIVIAKEYGFCHRNKVYLTGSTNRKNSDIIDVNIVFEYEDNKAGKAKLSNLNTGILNLI